jgi:hypothetical protein
MLRQAVVNTSRDVLDLRQLLQQPLLGVLANWFINVLVPLGGYHAASLSKRSAKTHHRGFDSGGQNSRPSFTALREQQVQAECRVN